MKQLLTILLLTAPLLSFAKDKSKEYQVGTYVRVAAVRDGTVTGTIRGDGTTVAGDVSANYVGIYTIKVNDGIWHVETMRQVNDSSMRNSGSTPIHFTAEKDNPLDFLKNGDKVMFRVEKHKALIGGPWVEMYIPFADKPGKEAKFVANYVPNVVPQQSVKPKPTDNVKAMCDSGRLSAEQHKQFCEGTQKF
jgi:hypothetical protein